ncbi:peptide synthetase [Pseudomonas sp. NZIPFR-PS5]|nr:peptide synthetase [Pseudomonas sp. NZIPFR-PS5]
MIKTRTLYDWFASTVASHGAMNALEVDDECLTYDELAARVEVLAKELLLKVEGQVLRRIGLMAARSVATYVGYLAILRIGCTVVPLNPAFPMARNIAISETAQLDIVVSELENVEGFSMPVVSLIGARDTGLHLTTRAVSPNDLAYILFTSGSTGTPKGVPISHLNISAYLDYVIARYELGPGARLSQMFDMTFDVSVFDMFATWGSGATLVVPTRNEVLAPVRFVNARQITHWCSVPSVISIAIRLRALRPDTMPSLRLSLFAGEPLTLKQAQAWQLAAPNSIVENFYGPTEVCITCANYRLPARQDDWPGTANGTVPIGTIYPHMEHVIINGSGERVNEGELCVRGPQRFPGYLNVSDNVLRFYDLNTGIAVAYDGETPLTNQHWYRTGDRVIDCQGVLVHQGRLDQQVKIRGYRVELGEIEAVLRGQVGVIDSVVIAVPGADAEIDLEAFYTGTHTDTTVLLDMLRLKLPPYMVPRKITALQEFPLNVNGKIDRHAISMLSTKEVV